MGLMNRIMATLLGWIAASEAVYIVAGNPSLTLAELVPIVVIGGVVALFIWLFSASG